MADPDILPKAMEYWYFAMKAGQALNINGLPTPTRIPSMPPVGKFGDKVILIHLAGYEDWRPRSPGTASSGTSSEQETLGPRSSPSTGRQGCWMAASQWPGAALAMAGAGPRP